MSERLYADGTERRRRRDERDAARARIDKAPIVSAIKTELRRPRGERNYAALTMLFVLFALSLEGCAEAFNHPAAISNW